MFFVCCTLEKLLSLSNCATPAVYNTNVWASQVLASRQAQSRKKHCFSLIIEFIFFVQGTFRGKMSGFLVSRVEVSDRLYFLILG
jgi:hypothetical protein